MESVSLAALPGAPPGSPEFRAGVFHDLPGLMEAVCALFHEYVFPIPQPPPAPPSP